MSDLGGSVDAAPLARELLVGPPAERAAAVLGAVLVVDGPRPGDRTAARVVEVEAYAGPGEDPGSHAHAGRRPRNRSMFAAPGHLYVYRSYGVHWCANVVVHDGRPGSAGAVLLRAAAVVLGRDQASQRRPGARDEHHLARGPGLLCAAVGLDGDDDGRDLCRVGSPVRLLPGTPPARVGSGPRVGVAGAGATTPWRWWEEGSPCVSRYRAAARRHRGSPRVPQDVGNTADESSSVA